MNSYKVVNFIARKLIIWIDFNGKRFGHFDIYSAFQLVVVIVV